MRVAWHSHTGCGPVPHWMYARRLEEEKSRGTKNEEQRKISNFVIHLRGEKGHMRQATPCLSE